ncbi:hypothetical protein GJ496_001000 [Pomphorhynchus laevis]|nr:hypothetical protein GJ496_001000 [Pomphorhynchus laevis]
MVYSSVGGVGPGAHQIMQTISKCRSSRSHLDYNDCISQLRQNVSIQIAKCASMALRMRTKYEHRIITEILYSPMGYTWANCLRTRMKLKKAGITSRKSGSSIRTLEIDFSQDLTTDQVFHWSPCCDGIIKEFTEIM